MNGWLWFLLALAALAALAIVVASVRSLHRHRAVHRDLHERFGDEYDYVVRGLGRRRGRAELEARIAEFADAPHHRVTPDERAASTQEFLELQFAFLDRPVGSVRDAERLVEHIMSERGMPVSDVESRAAALSVEMPELVTGYRRAYDTLQRADAGEPHVADLFRALRLYRDVIDQLLERPQREPAMNELGMPAGIGGVGADSGNHRHAAAG